MQGQHGAGGGAFLQGGHRQPALPCHVRGSVDAAVFWGTTPSSLRYKLPAVMSHISTDLSAEKKPPDVTKLGTEKKPPDVRFLATEK